MLFVTCRELWHTVRQGITVFFFSVSCFQLVRKQKQAEETKRAAVPSADQYKTTTSDFTDIPLSLPHQEPEDEKQDFGNSAETTDVADEKHQIPALQTLTESGETLQSTVVSKGAGDLTKSKEDDIGVAAPVVEHKAEAETTNLEKETQSWNPPCASFQLQIPNEASAPALYPSLPTLEEIHLVEETLKTTGKGPAVLALPEQESSPPSLQALDSVAEISKYKLYPELPKTAPEIQVIPLTMELLG